MGAVFLTGNNIYINVIIVSNKFLFGMFSLAIISEIYYFIVLALI